MTKFDADTALSAVGEGEFEGRISSDWSIVRGANGGHLAAIMLRAMRETVGGTSREPRSLSVHFIRVPRNDRFVVRAHVERHGRTMSNVSARMEQDDKLVVLAIGVFSEPRSGPEFVDLSMPEVPRPESLEPVPDRPDFPFGRQFEFRPALGIDPDRRAQRAELAVWMRLREPQVADHVVVTQLLDAFAPAVFTKLWQGGGGAGVPTVEMTFHYRESLPLPGAPSDEWHLGVFRSTKLRGGFVEEDGWLWSSSGVLIAQSRQLALVMTD